MKVMIVGSGGVEGVDVGVGDGDCEGDWDVSFL